MDRRKLAYIVGVALGDGNLSNPNGRAVRLRVSCDSRYTEITQSILSSLKKLMPNNKVAIVHRSKNCIDISCYSNKWPTLLGWTADGGPKEKQKVKVPRWIKNNNQYIKACLRGLFETDGSVYNDRGYIMTNFVTVIPTLLKDVVAMINKLGFAPNIQALNQDNRKIKYTVRISKNAKAFLRAINLKKYAPGKEL